MTAGQQLGALLVEMGFIDAAQLESALDEQNRSGRRLGKVLVAAGIITEERLVHALSRQLGIEPCDPIMTPVHDRVLELIPPTVAFRFRVLPVARQREDTGDCLYVATSDPLDKGALMAIRASVGPATRVRWMLAGETEMELALARHYGAPPAENTVPSVPVIQGRPVSAPPPPRMPGPSTSSPDLTPSSNTADIFAALKKAMGPGDRPTANADDAIDADQADEGVRFPPVEATDDVQRPTEVALDEAIMNAFEDEGSRDLDDPLLAPPSVGYGSSPGLVGSSPAQIASNPGLIGSSPSQIGSNPGLIGSSPSQIGSNPGLVGSSPAQTASSPGVVDDRLQATDEALVLGPAEVRIPSPREEPSKSGDIPPEPVSVHEAETKIPAPASDAGMPSWGDLLDRSGSHWNSSVSITPEPLPIPDAESELDLELQPEPEPEPERQPEPETALEASFPEPGPEAAITFEPEPEPDPEAADEPNPASAANGTPAEEDPMPVVEGDETVESAPPVEPYAAASAEVLSPSPSMDLGVPISSDLHPPISPPSPLQPTNGSVDLDPTIDEAPSPTNGSTDLGPPAAIMTADGTLVDAKRPPLDAIEAAAAALEAEADDVDDLPDVSDDVELQSNTPLPPDPESKPTSRPDSVLPAPVDLPAPEAMTTVDVRDAVLRFVAGKELDDTQVRFVMRVLASVMLSEGLLDDERLATALDKLR